MDRVSPVTLPSTINETLKWPKTAAHLNAKLHWCPQSEFFKKISCGQNSFRSYNKSVVNIVHFDRSTFKANAKKKGGGGKHYRFIWHFDSSPFTSKKSLTGLKLGILHFDRSPFTSNGKKKKKPYWFKIWHFAF